MLIKKTITSSKEFFKTRILKFEKKLKGKIFR